ncbi:MAG: MYG1 family protein [Candidatus Saccharibacteria bacterium]|nr:MYG1 family protein [Candidatus Saccharibacteria bacterium]
MITIEKNWKKAHFITHAGKFHADEVFATVILEQVYNDIAVARVEAVPPELPEGAVVYDIGYGKFDHHQKGGNGSRPASEELEGQLRDDATEVMYASCGLIWAKYGAEIMDSPELAQYIDETFIQLIDAGDNGQKNYVLSDIIEKFNPTWNEKTDPDVCFAEAVKVAKLIFKRVMAGAKSNLAARSIVEQAIEDSEDGLMVLDKYMTYEELVHNSDNPKAKDILFVVYPSNRAGYNVRAVSASLGEFGNRKDLPAEWAGLSGSALQEVTGVETAAFCHNSRFLVVASTLEDALKLAKLAIEA